MEINYSDGAAIEKDLLSLVESSNELDSVDSPGATRYGEWPVRYHLSAERANLLRHLDFSGLDVLELGAGMGAVSRFLAENAKHLTVVEGTQARFDVLKSRLRDLNNWDGVVSNIEAANVPGTYDVVCFVGVLEYSELFLKPPPEFPGSPFAWALAQAKAWLRPGGVCLVAIENKLGLKYWAGSAEDHTGRLFDGVCGYPEEKSPRTFSRQELVKLFHEVGLGEIEEYYPFPDYKIPASVLTSRAMQYYPELSAALAVSRRYENYGQPDVKLFPELLAARNLAYSGLLHELANSFLFLATDTPQSPTMHRLTHRHREGHELAWHYATSRRNPTVTVFRDHLESGATAEKRHLDAESGEAAAEGETLAARWSASPETPIAPGVPLRWKLAQAAYFEKGDAARKQLSDFLSWSMRRWATPETSQLAGEALDAIVTNATVSPDGTYQLFDLEWRLDSSMPKSWFVLRNVLALANDAETLAVSPWFASLAEAYVSLCAELNVSADLDADLRREAELQALVSNVAEVAHHHARITELVRRAVPAGKLPRRPVVKDESLRNLLASVSKKIARRALREVREPAMLKRGWKRLLQPLASPS